MKKTILYTCCCSICVFCATLAFLSFDFFSNPVKAATFNQVTYIEELRNQSEQIARDVNALQDNMTTYETTLQTCQKSLNHLSDALVDYYIDKLSDTSYVNSYNEGYVYYTAAENLGSLGKAAVPKLIQVLDTKNDYERSLALYALLLATQQEDVKAIVGDDYIKVNLDFDVTTHEEAVKTAKEWWQKYQSQF